MDEADEIMSEVSDIAGGADASVSVLVEDGSLAPHEAALIGVCFALLVAAAWGAVRRCFRRHGCFSAVSRNAGAVLPTTSAVAAAGECRMGEDGRVPLLDAAGDGEQGWGDETGSGEMVGGRDVDTGVQKGGGGATKYTDAKSSGKDSGVQGPVGGEARGAGRGETWLVVQLLLIFMLYCISSYGMFKIALLFLVERMTGTRDAGLVAMLASTIKTCQLFSNLLIGQLSDRAGRVAVFLLCYSGGILSCGLMAYSAERNPGVWTLFVAVTIVGTTNAMITNVCAAMADVTTGEARTRSMGLLSVTVGVGEFCGPLIFNTVAGSLGLTSVYLTMVGINLIGVLLLCFVRETLPAHKRSKAPLRFNPASSLRCVVETRRRVLVCIFGVLSHIGDQFYYTVFVYYAMNRYGLSRGYVSTLLSANGLAGIINQTVSFRLITRLFSDTSILVCASLVSMMAYLGFYLAPGVGVIWAALIARSIADSSYGPTMYSVASKTVRGAGETGKVMAGFKFCTIVGDVVGSQAAGQLFQFLSTSTTRADTGSGGGGGTNEGVGDDQAARRAGLVFVIASAVAGCACIVGVLLRRESIVDERRAAMGRGQSFADERALRAAASYAGAGIVGEGGVAKGEHNHSDKEDNAQSRLDKPIVDAEKAGGGTPATPSTVTKHGRSAV